MCAPHCPVLGRGWGRWHAYPPRERSWTLVCRSPPRPVGPFDWPHRLRAFVYTQGGGQGAGPRGTRPLPPTVTRTLRPGLGSRTGLRVAKSKVHPCFSLRVLSFHDCLGPRCCPWKRPLNLLLILFSRKSGMGAQFLLERKIIPHRFSVWSIESVLGTVPF